VTAPASVTGSLCLRGEVSVPGDKSISHRSLIFNALSRGRARVRGLLDSADVRSTASCLRVLGVDITTTPDGDVSIEGTDWSLREPADVLDCGNSGTTFRLLSGVLSGQPMHVVLTGDASLSSRPMSRITDPLRRMGARIDGRSGGSLAPLSIRGGALLCGRFRSPVASAQVKTALLLAGLQGRGEQHLEEPHLSRDHSERMLAAMGARLRRSASGCSVLPGSLDAVDIDVPGDISSAAFFLVAASIIPGSEVILRGVGLNPTRSGVLDVLRRMGADITINHPRTMSGEPVGDLVVRGAPLRGVSIGGGDIPRLLDELPVLAVAAAFAEGETVIRDAGELRVKESDRIAETASLLRAAGGVVTERPDGLVVTGGGILEGGGSVTTDDHRIAMSAAVAFAGSRSGGVVSGADVVGVSYPGFFETLSRLQQ
jgi:3-phosphoshikimate 1-carboxyvinyltransferase